MSGYSADGICYFCGNKADERYYSGSYDTYLECRCVSRIAWQDADWEARKLLRVAEERKQQMDKEAKIAKLQKQLKELGAE